MVQSVSDEDILNEMKKDREGVPVPKPDTSDTQFPHVKPPQALTDGPQIHTEKPTGKPGTIPRNTVDPVEQQMEAEARKQWLLSQGENFGDLYGRPPTHNERQALRPYDGSERPEWQGDANDGTMGPDQDPDVVKEAEDQQRQEDAVATQKQIANDAMGYLAKNDLLNEHTSEDIFQRNPDGTVKKDPDTGEPLVRPELKADQVLQPPTEVGSATFANASQAKAYLAEVSQAKTVTAEEHEKIKEAQAVIAQEYEAELIPLDEVGNSLDRIRDERPMEAASTAEKLNELLSGMEEGKIPLWARPAVTKVEQALASRGISASSIGRDSLFNAIINSAMPIAQADAAFEQDANKTNYSAKINAIMSDEAQKFAARQFNASSINQARQFNANLKTQVDLQNAARKDAMAQFNSQQKNALNMFNTQELNRGEQFNASQRQQVSLANAQAQTQVSLSNAQMATQVAIANAQASNQMAMHQSSLDAQREQFNAQNANAIAQADVAWRRQLNTADTAAKNAAKQANVKNAFNLTNQAQQNLWQQMRDEAHWAHQASENELARKHEGAMRLLVADIEAGRMEGAAPSKWDSVKDKLISTGIDKATEWLLGGD